MHYSTGSSLLSAVLFFLCVAFGVPPQAEGFAQTGGPASLAPKTVPGGSSRVAPHSGSSPANGSSTGRVPAERPSTERPPGDKPIIWLGGGLGFGTGGAPGQELAAHLEFSLHGEGPNVYMARASLVTDIFFHSRDLSLLYGRAADQAAALAGVALTNVDSTSTVGLALQARLRLFTLGPWGLGLTTFANVNLDSSFGGLSLTLELGNF